MADLIKSVTNLKPVSNTIFSDSSKPEGDQAKKKSGNESNKNIQLKEFFWDQFLIYVATGIALLTLLDVSIQFFRSNGGLQCYVPMDVLPQEFTRDNAAYVNTFCLSSLTWSEYYSVFILIQGILVVAPHYLWTSVFSGRFDFFVDLVKQLDRLRDSDTGDYRPKNIDIVKKLEQEFPEKWKWTGIFALYILKLAAHLLIIIGSLIVNVAAFPQEDFSFVFSCPRDFNGSTDRVEGWSFPVAVSCSYPSFRVLSRIQIANYVLLILGLGSVVFGLFWCAKRHPSSLGYKLVAKFAFSSSLAPEEYVSKSLWKKPWKMLSILFRPRIMNDLDFLVMRLFRADSGHGRVFKDIQVSKEIKSQITKDHVLLHLLNDAIKDKHRNQRTGSSTLTRDQDIRDYFRGAGFDQPDAVNDQVYNVMMGQERLGNMEFEPVGGLRDRLFGFFQFAPQNELAYDISFGTVGCSLILARGFKEVISVNFHPFYRNAKEVVKKEGFQVNYCSVIVQQDIFAQKTENLRTTDEAIDDEINFRDPESRRVIQTKQINFIVVGPFVQDATRGTVNLHIERMNTGRYFSKNAVLLAIRPMVIAGKDVSGHFCKYEPAKELFRVKKEVELKLREAFPDSEHGLVPVTCADVECTFEFIMYSFQGGEEPAARSRRPPERPPPKLSEESPSRHSSIQSFSRSPTPLPKSKKNSQSSLIPEPPILTIHGQTTQSEDLLQFSPDDKDNRARDMQRTKTTNVTAAFNRLSEMASPLESAQKFSFSQASSSNLQVQTNPIEGEQNTIEKRSNSFVSPGTPV